MKGEKRRKVAIRDLVVNAQSGQPAGERAEGGLLQLRMNSLTNEGKLDLTGAVRIPRTYYNEQYLLQSNDIIFNNTNSAELVGRAAIFHGADEPVTFSNHLTRLRVNSSDCVPGYLAAWIHYQWQCGKQRSITTRFIGQSSVGTESLLSQKIQLPARNVQDTATSILSALDEAVTQLSQVLIHSKRNKLAALGNLFSQPALGDSAKPTRLGSLCTERKERGCLGLPTMSITMHDGVVDREDLGRRVESELTPEEHLLVRKGDIAYNMMRMWQGVSGLAAIDCLVSPAYVVVTPKKSIDPLYASYLFKNPEVIRLFHRYSQGLANDRLRLYFEQFAEIPIRIVTQVEEQKRIAGFLAACDRRITAAQNYLERSLSLKRAISADIFDPK